MEGNDRTRERERKNENRGEKRPSKISRGRETPRARKEWRSEGITGTDNEKRETSKSERKGDEKIQTEKRTR